MSEFDDMGDIVQKYCECVDPEVNAKNNCCEACGMLFNFGGAYIDGSSVPGFHEEVNSHKALNERRRIVNEKIIDPFIGQKFGTLTVEKKSSRTNKHNQTLWTCKCDCGNIVELLKAKIRKPNRTCGDRSKHRRPGQFYEELPMSHFNRTKTTAKTRNIEFNLTPEYIWEIFLKQNRKCALTGVELYFTQSGNTRKTRVKETTASLDRIESNIGYIKGNVQWVHKDINRIKWTKNNESFLEICKLVKKWSDNQDRQKIDRPDWHTYFMGLAFAISQRSHDVNKKHGCIITANNKILGTGYNGLPKGMSEDILPNTRPEKNLWMIHAEENAILNCSDALNKYPNLVAYVTGKSCTRCLKMLWNVGVTQIYMARRQGSITEALEALEFDLIVGLTGLTVTLVDPDIQWLQSIILDDLV